MYSATLSGLVKNYTSGTTTHIVCKLTKSPWKMKNLEGDTEEEKQIVLSLQIYFCFYK